ncbi:hypothetical protein CBR_g25891 [Chara braunii]|uniref:Reverse transcriptase domain-containing protein n=1 Tax=Chara braunii TaxID=69332 RepID=A0A388L6M6_CHABU|nr:hypothetical protein CBR_g25891 [Chara braunii]|eukprot:GBG77960.1 hypothetical protein CBR_g25891 [Chara braunii]
MARPMTMSRPVLKRGTPTITIQTRKERKISQSQPTLGESSKGPQEKEPIMIEEGDDEEEDERLRAEDELLTKQRAMERDSETGKAKVEEEEPRKKKNVYTIPVEKMIDFEQLVDRILESQRDLVTLKEILAVSSKLLEEFKQRMSRKKVMTFKLSEIIPPEEKEVYYKEDCEWIRTLKEKGEKGPCRLTDGRVKEMIIGEYDLLTKEETQFFIDVMKKIHLAYVFDDDERGRLDIDMIPMTRIHTVPHQPWNVKGLQYPNPDDHRKVVNYLDGKVWTKVVDYSYGSYASPWFYFIKQNGILRWVQDLQKLNSVTVRDAGGLPNADQLSESCAGRPIITLIDLYSRYDQYPLYTTDRPMTAMHTPRGLLHMCAAPQGWTNVVTIVQRYMMRVMQPLCPDVTSPYIDDLAIRVPRVKDETEVLPGVRKFVWKHVRNVEKVMRKLKEYNLTASGVKSTHGRPFIIESGAGPTTLGGVLIQKDGEGRERPLGFENRTLNIAERNYSQFKKETLAVLQCLRIFRNHVFGRRFILRVDPTALAQLLKNYSPSDPTISRWLTYIWMFNFEIERISDTQNLADGLSRVDWDSSTDEAKDSIHVDGFLEVEESQLSINAYTYLADAVARHGKTIWNAPSFHHVRPELVMGEPFIEEDPWGERTSEQMMSLALSDEVEFIKEPLTIEYGHEQADKTFKIIGEMSFLVDSLIHEDRLMNEEAEGSQIREAFRE